MLASGVGILRLMPANDLSPRTTRLGVFSFRSNGTVGWLSASEWDQYLEGCPAMNTKVLGTSILDRTRVATTRNTVIRPGWSRIGLAVLDLHAVYVGLKGRPAVISGRYDNSASQTVYTYKTHD